MGGQLPEIFWKKFWKKFSRLTVFSLRVKGKIAKKVHEDAYSKATQKKTI